MKCTFILFISLCIRSIELHRQKHHGDRNVIPIEDENEMTYIQQGSYKNKLEAEYGVNFRYLRKVKNGLDRVTVVTSIPISRYDKLKVKPLEFGKCSDLMKVNSTGIYQGQILSASLEKRLLGNQYTSISAAKEWYTKASPYLEYIKQQEKFYVERVHDLLCEDLYASLR